MTDLPLVIVTDRVGPDDHGELVIGLVRAHRARSTRPVTVITWDGGPRVDRLTGARHREVDAINKWWLPKTLVRSPLTRPIGRALRHGRVRWWWRRAGAGPEVVVVGRNRPELEHYVPPGPTVERVADDAVGPRGTAVWRPWVRALARAEPGDPVVVAWGPPTWAAGVDQFLQLAWWWGRQGITGRFVWCHPRDEPPGPEVRHDIDALGIGDLLTFVAADGAVPLAARGADAAVGCARTAEATPPTVLSVPWVAFGSGGAAPRFGRPEALGEVLRTALARVLPEPG